MNANAGRLSILLFALVAFWIGVYWWWPVSDPGVSAQQLPDEPPVVTPITEPITEPITGPATEPGSRTTVAPNTATREPAVISNPPRNQAPDPADSKTAPATDRPDPAPAVIAPQFTEHTVQRGETFASIARKYYGNSRLAGAIARANPFVDPQRLRPGRVIRVPKDPGNIQGVPAEPTPDEPGQPAAGPYSEYTVQRGDTLSGIAQKLYGDPSLASVIYQANRSILRSEDDINIGQVLKIPPKP